MKIFCPQCKSEDTTPDEVTCKIECSSCGNISDFTEIDIYENDALNLGISRNEAKWARVWEYYGINSRSVEKTS